MHPHLIVITGPSGVGKQSIIRELQERMGQKGIQHTFSVSSTTRSPRPGEVDGVHYHFRTREDFEGMVGWQQFLEHATVHGNLYGTESRQVTDALQEGQCVIADVDVQGAATIRANATLKHIPFIDIFIAPPSPEVEVLESRLRSRGTDAEDVIQKRLQNAKGELSRKSEFSFVVVNTVLDDAVRECFEHILGKLNA